MTSPWQSVSVMLSRFIGELCCMLCSVLSRMEFPSIEVDSLNFTSFPTSPRSKEMPVSNCNGFMHHLNRYCLITKIQTAIIMCRLSDFAQCLRCSFNCY